MKTATWMILAAAAALPAILHSNETQAQGWDCKVFAIRAQGEGIAQKLAENSCRIRWKKASVKKHGGAYDHFKNGKNQQMRCTGRAPFVSCECSAIPCR